MMVYLSLFPSRWGGDRGEVARGNRSMSRDDRDTRLQTFRLRPLYLFPSATTFPAQFHRPELSLVMINRFIILNCFITFKVF